MSKVSVKVIAPEGWHYKGFNKQGAVVEIEKSVYDDITKANDIGVKPLEGVIELVNEPAKKDKVNAG